MITVRTEGQFSYLVHFFFLEKTFRLSLLLTVYLVVLYPENGAKLVIRQ